jgi:hypothetical protein
MPMNIETPAAAHTEICPENGTSESVEFAPTMTPSPDADPEVMTLSA